MRNFLNEIPNDPRHNIKVGSVIWYSPGYNRPHFYIVTDVVDDECYTRFVCINNNGETSRWALDLIEKLRIICE